MHAATSWPMANPMSWRPSPRRASTHIHAKNVASAAFCIMSVSHVHLQIWFVRPTSIQLSHKMRWCHAWKSLIDHRFLTTSTSPTSRISACSTAFLRTDTAENRYSAPSKYNRGYNNGMGFASNLEKVVSGCVARHVEFNTTLRCWIQYHVEVLNSTLLWGIEFNTMLRCWIQHVYLMLVVRGLEFNTSTWYWIQDL